MTGSGMSYDAVANEPVGPGDDTGAAPARVGNGSAVASAAAVANDSAHALRADLVASGYGLTGAGAKIGIISDSFNALGGAAADGSDGALPPLGDIQVLKDDPHGTDEGRALAEVVHSIAPYAPLAFYTGDGGVADFAAGVTALQNAGCSIILDDLDYFDEPFFQFGDPIEKAIHQFTAAGGIYLTAAGNAGPQSAYEDTWRPGNTDLPGIGAVQAMNFGSADAPSFLEPAYLTAGLPTVFELQTDQPWKSIDGTGSAYSLAFAVYDPYGRLVLTSSGTMAGGDPVRIAAFTPTMNGVYSIALFGNGGTDPGDTFKINVNNDGYVSVGLANASGSGSEVGHATDPNAITVGAVDSQDTPAYGRAPTSEPFGSAGPGEVLRSTKGKPLSSPVDLGKTDVSGVDDQPTTLPADTGLADFYGTSAAVASVAGVVALMKQADPFLTGATAKSLLEQSATPTSSAAVQAGAGLVRADQAVALASSRYLQGPETTGAPAAARTVAANTLAGSSGGPSASMTATVSEAPGPAGADTGSQPTGPMLTFDRNVAARGAPRFAMRGTVSDPTGIASLEVYATSARAGGPVAIGAATVHADGTWSVVDREDADTQTDIVAVATDRAGGTTTASAPYELEAGIAAKPYAAEQDRFDAAGAFTGQTFFARHSSVYDESRYHALPSGLVTYTYSGGSAFADGGSTSYTDTYRPDGTLLHEVVDEADGAHVITALASGQTLDGVAEATFEGPGTRETFRLAPGFGTDRLDHFVAAGPRHDTLALSTADFGSVAGVLADTTQVGGRALVSDPVSGDTVALVGVSRADLAHHMGDIHLFG